MGRLALLVAAVLFATVQVAPVRAKQTHVHLRIVKHTKLASPPDGQLDIYEEPPADEFVEPIALDEETPKPTAAPAVYPLPVFFFHGVTSNGNSGYNYNANLTAEGRLFVPLSFCPDLCSITALNSQVPLAIKQIRATVANDTRFAKGYVFIGHSQGAAIARAVIEEMDDHQVRMFISLAGPQNGIFYGPQASDAIPTLAFANRIGPKTIPAPIFDFSKYTSNDYATGKFQFDFNALVFNFPALQDKLSVVNLGRSPVKHAWRKLSTFLPTINNVNPCVGEAAEACEADKLRRKNNFLKLKSAHFFGSPDDDVIAPWQTSVLGQYTDLATSDDILLNFPLLQAIDMKLTDEYQQDTYGLKSLEAKDGLFLYPVPGVGHSCWVADALPLGKSEKCLFKTTYDGYIYPLLQEKGWGVI